MTESMETNVMQVPTTANVSVGTLKRAIFDVPLSCQRYKWVMDFVESKNDIRSHSDLGCGNGRILAWIKTVPHLELINFVDIDSSMLEFDMDHFRPGLCEMLFGRECSSKPLEIKVYHGDLTVPDDRIASDCFSLVEVIEHMELSDVDRLTRAVFGYYQPKYVLITTPNSEFNHLLRNEGESPTTFRHYDHKFEWTRNQFLTYCQSVCNLFPYSFQLDGVGHLPHSEPFGPCTQIAAFTLQPQRQNQNTQHDKDLISFDLLLNKLDVREGLPEWRPDRKKVSLLAEYKIPGGSGRHEKEVSTEPFDWNS